MRQRITYILQDVDFDPAKKLKVAGDTLNVSELKGVKEHHITASYEELPIELRNVFQDCHELRLRWSTPRPYENIAPFVSRVSPGLHVFLTPLKDKPVRQLCFLLKKLFGDDMQCESPKESFISPPILSETFHSSPARQFYQYMPTLTDVAQWIEQKVCKAGNDECKQHARDLERADYFDADYDSIANTFMLRAFWSRSSSHDGVWSASHTSVKDETLEVGVLMNERSSDPEQLSFSGWLTVPGQNSKPSQTMFETPARHHSVAAKSQTSFITTFQQPTGMHPVMQLTFSSNDLTPPAPSCALHTYLTLPATLFLDRYPFSDALFLKSHNLKALANLSGATDLEAPIWTVAQWGSAALLELASPPESIPASGWNVTIPLHLRYMSPTQDASGLADTYVPWPIVFWACKTEEGTKFRTSPFDRANLGYDGLFDRYTMFYHVSPDSSRMNREVLKVPVLDLNKSDWAEFGTIAVISLGSLYIFAQLLWSLWVQYRPARVSVQKKKL